MNITETNKFKIQALLNTAMNQHNDIESITLQVSSNFNIESFVPFLLTDKWAQAVDPLLIADPNSEEDKLSRAHGILSIVISEPITGKFLDFGCGEGHVAAEVGKRGFSVGYDVEKQGWDKLKQTNAILTTSWDDVVKNGPYDCVLLYDVLDHMKDEQQPPKELGKIREVLSDKGKIFARMHPWCSRHGTHLYLSINKAYLHMCLSEESLDKLGYKYLHTLKIIHPLNTYNKWFEEAGLNVISSSIVPETVEPFFKQGPIAELIKRHWRSSYQEDLAAGREFPEFQMRQQLNL
jgi:2-polyprenyl-3-methyl-5-hydroxy-6-metoxy-1,4-benzoquinol methylase